MAVGNIHGMDPELAKVAMTNLQTKKAELVKETTASTLELTEKIDATFFGMQTTSMKNFVSKINGALENLYKHLDGNESSFASKFEEVIGSYVTSDENVSLGYDDSGAE